MKTIGLIGGMSWESSIEYYRIINQKVREKLGGTHSAKSVMVSVDFAEIEILQRERRWAEATRLLIDAAMHLEAARADFVVLCTNTMHKMADDIIKSILDSISSHCGRNRTKSDRFRIPTIGLLGTRFTMEEDFYKGRLSKNYGLNVLIPDESDRLIIHRVIYDELVRGVILPESRNSFH